MVFASAATAQDADAPGAVAYKKYCAACHDTGVARAPVRDALSRLSPRRILGTLDFGLMMSVAYPMRRDEREAVASYLGKGSDELAPPAKAMCAAGQRIFPRPSKASWAGWAPARDNARFQDTAGAGITVAQLGRLKLEWAYGFPGDVIAFAAPTVIDGTLFVGSAGGTIQALDARSGCVHWVYQASGPVRSPPHVVEDGGRRVLLTTDQVGNMYALDAHSGKALWKKRIETHEAARITGAIVTHEGIAFVPAASWEETRAMDAAYPCCTFRGSLTALRVRDGSQVWRTWFVDPPQKTRRFEGTATSASVPPARACGPRPPSMQSAAWCTWPRATTTRIPARRRATRSSHSSSPPVASVVAADAGERRFQRHVLAWREQLRS